MSQLQNSSQCLENLSSPCEEQGISPAELNKILQTPAGFALMASQGQWNLYTTGRRYPHHLTILNEKLLDVAEGRITRLLITMPPRHGKSEFASKYFPAWFLGRFPDKKIILASYEADFASQWGRKVRDLLEQFGDRFFGVSIRRDSKAANRWEIMDYAGGMQTAGVGGAITGKGADVLIIDDPVKDSEQANSEVYREKTWEWYTSTAYTRLEPGGAVILIQTRWHEDDLAGRILDQARKTGEPWITVNLPAIAGEQDELGRDPGEPLWPERYNLGDLNRIRGTQGSYQFGALYQQSPVAPAGNVFKRSWFQYWKNGDDNFYRLGASCRSVDKKRCRRFGTVDLAFSLKKEADYTVIAAWAVTPQCDLILLDFHRERMEGPALQRSIRAMVEKHDLDYMGIEKVLGQSLVVHGARLDGLTVRSLIADTDKLTRSIPAQVRMEAGQIFFPTNHPDLEVWEQELLTFPRGTHDDCVDVLSYAAADVQRFGPPAPLENDVREREMAELAIQIAAKRDSDFRAQANIEDDRWWDRG